MREHAGHCVPIFKRSNKSATCFAAEDMPARRRQDWGGVVCSSLEQRRCCVVTKRGWCALACVWFGVGLPGLAMPVAAAPAACAQSDLLTLRAVVPGVAVVHGHWPTQADTGSAPARPARLATMVVLGQGRQVTVVDPGPTRRVGRALQNTLQCRQQARVTAVINTHAHAEQVLANSAFNVPVQALSGTAQAMQKRCPQCLAALREDLGARALQGTRIVLPSQTLHDGQRLQVGGRLWQVIEMPWAHTESDLVLWSQDADGGTSESQRMGGGVVLVGGLVDGRWPVLAQGRVLGWLQALDRVQAMQPDWLIGQHVVAGPQQVLSVLQRQRDYLCGLLGHAWRRLELGQSEAEGVQGLVVPANWPTPEIQDAHIWRQQHLFNQLRAWREAEQLWLERQAWPVQCGSAPDIGR